MRQPPLTRGDRVRAPWSRVALVTTAGGEGRAVAVILRRRECSSLLRHLVGGSFCQRGKCCTELRRLLWQCG